MKIKIINPDFGMTRAEMDSRCSILQKYTSPGTILSMDCLVKNQVYIDSQLDIVLAGSEIVSMAKQAEAQGYDAVVLYCFSDPALAACRELLTIPVIGGGQAAYLTAMAISRHIGLIVTQENRIPEKKLFVHETGIAPERVASIKAINLQGHSINTDVTLTMAALEETCIKLIEEGAQALVLGCLSFLGMGQQLSTTFNIPVIDSGIAAVSMAESLVRQNLKTSKLAYPKPPIGNRTWENATLNVE